MHLVMFDLDGTLVESNGFDGALYVQSVRAVLGIELSSNWGRYRHVTDSGILDEVMRSHGCSDQDGALRRRVREDFIGRTAAYLDAHEIKEISGAKALLEALLAHPQTRLAIATGGWHETACLKLLAIGIDPGALTLATSSDALSRTEIMQLAEQRALAGVAARSKTYFGDGPWDLEAALQLHYRFIAVGEAISHQPAYVDLTNRSGILAALGLAP